jgi:glyoxylase-like metal-dependent hydrolase (beta-lactamase superfamily II)
LADSVYAIVRTTRPADPSDANTLVITHATDVVVVDGNITPQSTRAVIAEIRKPTKNPVRYVIITHFHSDHHTGNIEYRRAWPGVELVAHVHTREDVLSDDVKNFRRIVSKGLSGGNRAPAGGTRQRCEGPWFSHGDTGAGTGTVNDRCDPVFHRRGVDL